MFPRRSILYPHRISPRKHSVCLHLTSVCRSQLTSTTTTATSAANEKGTVLFKFTDPELNKRALTVKDQLLQWCQSKTVEYEVIIATSGVCRLNTWRERPLTAVVVVVPQTRANNMLYLLLCTKRWLYRKVTSKHCLILYKKYTTGQFLHWVCWILLHFFSSFSSRYTSWNYIQFRNIAT